MAGGLGEANPLFETNLPDPSCQVTLLAAVAQFGSEPLLWACETPTREGAVGPTRTRHCPMQEGQADQRSVRESRARLLSPAPTAEPRPVFGRLRSVGASPMQRAGASP
jgi:hypothetical protein